MILRISDTQTSLEKRRIASWKRISGPSWERRRFSANAGGQKVCDLQITPTHVCFCRTCEKPHTHTCALMHLYYSSETYSRKEKQIIFSYLICILLSQFKKDVLEVCCGSEVKATTQHTFTRLGGRMGIKYLRQCEKRHLYRKMF